MQTEVNPVVENQPCVGKRVCGAKTRSGGKCQRAPMENGKCYLHGGPSPKGAASPHFIDGRYSKYFRQLPQAMRDGFEEGMKDPEFLSLKEDIVLQSEFIRQDLLKFSETKIPPWEEAIGLLRQLRKAEEPDEVEKAMTDLETVLNEGRDATRLQEVLKERIRELFQERAKSVAIEHKMRLDMKTLVSVDDVYQFAGALWRIVQRHSPREVMAKIEEDAAYLLPAPKKKTEAVDGQ